MCSLLVHVLLLDRCTRPAEKRGTAHADLLVGAQVLADQCKQSAGDSIWVSLITLYFLSSSFSFFPPPFFSALRCRCRPYSKLVTITRRRRRGASNLARRVIVALVVVCDMPLMRKLCSYRPSSPQKFQLKRFEEKMMASSFSRLCLTGFKVLFKLKLMNGLPFQQ